MGDRASRAEYVEVLREYLLDARRRARATSSASGWRANPLRVLDSKREDWQDVIERAPQLTEYLERRRRVRTSSRCSTGSTRSASQYELAPRLVRGFDYYTSTTFEFVSDALDAAQNAIGGGGRYDELAEEMGGQPTPGIGFGIGHRARADRVRGRGRARRRPSTRLDAFVVDGLGAAAREALRWSQELREAGLRADRAYGDRSVKAQMEARPTGREPRSP